MKSQLAQRGLNIRARIAELEAELMVLNRQLIDLVGDGGESFKFENGSVLITQRTADRPAGTYTQSFKSDVFNALPENSKLKRDIIAAGVVTFEQGVTKGRAPVVQYKLA